MVFGRKALKSVSIALFWSALWTGSPAFAQVENRIRPTLPSSLTIKDAVSALTTQERDALLMRLTNAPISMIKSDADLARIVQNENVLRAVNLSDNGTSTAQRAIPKWKRVLIALANLLLELAS